MCNKIDCVVAFYLQVMRPEMLFNADITWFCGMRQIEKEGVHSILVDIS